MLDGKILRIQVLLGHVLCYKKRHGDEKLEIVELFPLIPSNEPLQISLYDDRDSNVVLL